MGGPCDKVSIEAYEARDYQRTLVQEQRKILAAKDAEISELKAERDNHAETLRGIAQMDPTTEGTRMVQWAKDGLSGYVESTDTTIKKLQDEISELKAEIERLKRWKEAVLRTQPCLSDMLCPDMTISCRDCVDQYYTAKAAALPPSGGK